MEEREFKVDVDFVNLFMNGICNDYAKMACASIIFYNKPQISTFGIEELLQYAIIYDESYFANRFFSAYKVGRFDFDDAKFLYLDYTKDENLYNNLKNEYLTEKIMKKEKKSVAKAEDIRYRKKCIYKVIKRFKKDTKLDYDIKMASLNHMRLELISSISRYKFLCKLYGIEENKSIDRLYNWNIKQVKKHNTIKDKLHIM